MLLVFIFLLFLIIAAISCNIKFVISISNNRITGNLIVCIFGKIRLLNLDLNKRRKNFLEAKKWRVERDKKNIIKIIKMLNFRVEKFNLNIDICTGSPPLTALASSFVSIFIGCISSSKFFNINFQKFHYKVQPRYTSESEINVKFNCIISQSLVHIICVIYRFAQDRRGEEYGRKSSNRRAYGNGYEQHKAND